MIVQSYQEATDWLRGGKRKYERPLYTRGLYLRRKPGNQFGPSQDIEVYCKWSRQSLVTYHVDGTTTIQGSRQPTFWGGMYNPIYSWSQRAVYRDFAMLKNVYQRNSKVYVVTQDAAYKQGKVQKCRKCKGSGLIDGWCQLAWCYITDCDKPNIIDTEYNRYHRHLCPHNMAQGHFTPKSDQCYNCSGTGSRLYGAGYTPMLWDGSPIRLQDGVLVNNKPSELEKAMAAYVSIS